MAEDELEHIHLEPADNGYTIKVERRRKEGRKGEIDDHPRHRPKIAADADSALAIIAKELGAKGRKGRKGEVTLMAEGEPSTKHESKKKVRRKTSYKRG